MYKLCDLATMQLKKKKKKHVEETHTIGNIYKDKQRIGNMLVIMRLEAKEQRRTNKILYNIPTKKKKERERAKKKPKHIYLI